MPPRLSDYTSADWLRLRPVTHRLKTARYRRTDRWFRRQPARSGDVAALAEQIRDRRTLVTIAFNDRQTIVWQTALLRHYVGDVVHVVADNSPEDAVAATIAAAARVAGVAYVRLPCNPTAAPSRSHGLALNWVWHNVIKPGRPEVFGFLDDDIYPTAPDDPLSAQGFYGVVRPGIASAPGGPSRWFLWAGFCMFRTAALGTRDLDFSQDWFCGLDTGGGNWEVLYRHVARAQLREQDTRFVAFRDGLRWEDGPLQWCGPWLHAVGLMGKPDLMPAKAEAVARLLAPHLAAAGALSGG
jgi:hypothetical protein